MRQQNHKLNEEQLKQALAGPLPNDQLFKARIKANDYVADYLKQLILLSTGTLVLTVTFLKDVLGPNAGSASLSWLIPAVWILLGASIACCVLGLARLTFNLDVPDMEPGHTGIPKAFLAGSATLVPSSRSALFTFAAAMIALAIFAAVNFHIFFQKAQPSVVEKAAISAEQAASKAETAAIAASVEAKRTAEEARRTTQLLQDLLTKGTPPKNP